MPIAFLSAHSLSDRALAPFQAGSNMGGAGMVAMMAVCAIFGVVLFIALVELVILEYLWIKLWSRRLRAESRGPSITSRAA
jgi:hypothetical protein